MGAINTFSSILPILGAASGVIRAVDTTLSAIDTITGRADDSYEAEQKLAMKQLKAQQRLQEQQQAQQTGLERERMAAESAQAEGERRLALKRAVSRQRANFGSQGVGSGGGSAEAVLLGLFDESDADRTRREELDGFRNRALDLDTAQNRSLNLLQATQLSQRQNLSRLF